MAATAGYVSRTSGVQEEIKSIPALHTRCLKLEVHKLTTVFATWDGTGRRTTVLLNVEMA
jgi:hypothetical protein